MSVRITTNNVPRDIIDAYQLSEKERKDFDYIDWQAVEEGNESASFFRYRGTLYDLGEFMFTGGMDSFAGWDGYQPDTFFSGIVVKYANEFESVVVGTFYAEGD